MKLEEAEGNLFQFPSKFVVKDINCSKLMCIEGKTFSLRRECSLYYNTRKFFGHKKSKLLNLKGQGYWLERNGVEFMRIYGNFTWLDYKMEINRVQVATVDKKWFAIQDQIGLYNRRSSRSSSSIGCANSNRAYGSYQEVRR